MNQYFENLKKKKKIFIVCEIIFKCPLFIARLSSKYRKWKLFASKKKKKLTCSTFNSLEWSYDKIMSKIFDI